MIHKSSLMKMFVGWWRVPCIRQKPKETIMTMNVRDGKVVSAECIATLFYSLLVACISIYFTVVACATLRTNRNQKKSRLYVYITQSYHYFYTLHLTLEFFTKSDKTLYKILFGRQRRHLFKIQLFMEAIWIIFNFKL